MAIIYTYPILTDPSSSDLVLISDSKDNNKTKQVSIHNIRGATTAGVSSIIAGTNVSISPAAGTGDVTINSSSGGVTSFTNTNGTYVSATTQNASATGAVTVGNLDLSAVDGSDATTSTRFLSKDNKWETPTYTTDTNTTYTYTSPSAGILRLSDSSTNQDVTVTGSGGMTITSGGTNILNINNGKPFDELNFQADSGANFALSNNGTLDISGGVGIDSLSNGSGEIRLGLANTAVTAGTYGDATNVSQITIDAQGRITNAANVALSASSVGNGELLHSNIFKGTNSSQTNPPKHVLNDATTTTTALNQVQFNPATAGVGTGTKVFTKCARPQSTTDIVRVVFNFSLLHDDNDGTPDSCRIFAGLHHADGNIAPASLTYGWQGSGYTDSDDTGMLDVRNYRFSWDITVSSLLDSLGNAATSGETCRFFLKMNYMDSILTNGPSVIFGQYFTASYASTTPLNMINGIPLTADTYLLDNTKYNANPIIE